MESSCNLLVVLDAGHGGQDFGACFMGRCEKDDNLRLALETQKQLSFLGIPALTTRASDTFAPPAIRAEIANKTDADLFISLHRASSPKPNEDAAGIESFVYLTSPLETSGRAAQLILSELADAGVQRIIGVSRGNFGVLRRAAMPAILLDMGFINNEIDNRLFDINITAYAGAIARGAAAYFGLLTGAAFLGGGQDCEGNGTGARAPEIKTLLCAAGQDTWRALRQKARCPFALGYTV